MDSYDGEKNGESGIIPPHQKIFQEEWDQHDQLVGGKGKIKNLPQA